MLPLKFTPKSVIIRSLNFDIRQLSLAGRRYLARHNVRFSVFAHKKGYSS